MSAHSCSGSVDEPALRKEGRLITREGGRSARSRCNLRCEPNEGATGSD